MRLHILSLPLLATLMFGAPAHAAGYRLHDISGNGLFQSASAINNAGQIVGGSESGGFYYSPATGLLRLQDQPPADSPTPFRAWGVDINASGRAVGQWQATDTSPARTFTYTPGEGMRDLGQPWITPAAIDDRGRVVGMTTFDAPGSPQVFVSDPTWGMRLFAPPAPLSSVVGLLSDGVAIANRQDSFGDYTHAGYMIEGAWSDLLMPSAASGDHAQDVNASGTVVGDLQYAYDAGMLTISRPFAYSQATGLTDLTAFMPQVPFTSFATAINDNDVVIGRGQWTPETGSFSFIHDLATGTFVDLATALDPLSSAGWSALALQDINDLGQIVGTGLFHGEQRAFLLSPVAPVAPVPEPGAALMLLAGSAAVAGIARRRRQRA